jgi:hypothetical protein
MTVAKLDRTVSVTVANLDRTVSMTVAECIVFCMLTRNVNVSML